MFFFLVDKAKFINEKKNNTRLGVILLRKENLPRLQRKELKGDGRKYNTGSSLESSKK